jgi:hypothetical protein
MKDFIVLLRFTLFWAVMRKVDSKNTEPTTNLHCITSQKTPILMNTCKTECHNNKSMVSYISPYTCTVVFWADTF